MPNVALRSFQSYTASDEILNAAVEEIKSAVATAKSSGAVQVVSLFRRGYRSDLQIGEVFVVPPAVCNDMKDFPLALLKAQIRNHATAEGMIEFEMGALIDPKDMSSETLKAFKDIVFREGEGEHKVLLVFRACWSSPYDAIGFLYDEATVFDRLREVAYAAPFNPALSSVLDALHSVSDAHAAFVVSGPITQHMFNLPASEEQDYPKFAPGISFAAPEEGGKAKKASATAVPCRPVLRITAANIPAMEKDVLSDQELSMLASIDQEVGQTVVSSEDAGLRDSPLQGLITASVESALGKAEKTPATLPANYPDGLYGEKEPNLAEGQLKSAAEQPATYVDNDFGKGNAGLRHQPDYGEEGSVETITPALVDGPDPKTASIPGIITPMCEFGKGEGVAKSLAEAVPGVGTAPNAVLPSKFAGLILAASDNQDIATDVNQTTAERTASGPEVVEDSPITDELAKRDNTAKHCKRSGHRWPSEPIEWEGKKGTYMCQDCGRTGHAKESPKQAAVDPGLQQAQALQLRQVKQQQQLQQRQVQQQQAQAPAPAPVVPPPAAATAAVHPKQAAVGEAHQVDEWTKVYGQPEDKTTGGSTTTQTDTVLDFAHPSQGVNDEPSGSDPDSDGAGQSGGDMGGGTVTASSVVASSTPATGQAVRTYVIRNASGQHWACSDVGGLKLGGFWTDDAAQEAHKFQNPEEAHEEVRRNCLDREDGAIVIPDGIGPLKLASWWSPGTLLARCYPETQPSHTPSSKLAKGKDKGKDGKKPKGGKSPRPKNAQSWWDTGQVADQFAPDLVNNNAPNFQGELGQQEPPDLVNPFGAPGNATPQAPVSLAGCPEGMNKEYDGVPLKTENNFYGPEFSREFYAPQSDIPGEDLTAKQSAWKKKKQAEVDPRDGEGGALVKAFRFDNPKPYQGQLENRSAALVEIDHLKTNPAIKEIEVFILWGGQWSVTNRWQRSSPEAEWDEQAAKPMYRTSALKTANPGDPVPPQPQTKTAPSFLDALNLAKPEPEPKGTYIDPQQNGEGVDNPSPAYLMIDKLVKGAMGAYVSQLIGAFTFTQRPLELETPFEDKLDLAEVLAFGGASNSTAQEAAKHQLNHALELLSDDEKKQVVNDGQAQAAVWCESENGSGGYTYEVFARVEAIEGSVLTVKVVTGIR